MQRILITVLEDGETAIHRDDCMVITLTDVDREEAKTLVADYLDLAYDEYEEGKDYDDSDIA